MDQSVSAFGYHGLIIFCLDCVYDEDGSFKKFHDKLKGSKTKYVLTNIKKRKKSRMRKKSATVSSINFVILDKVKLGNLNHNFQKNMKNSNGKPRKK